MGKIWSWRDAKKAGNYEGLTPWFLRLMDFICNFPDDVFMGTVAANPAVRLGFVVDWTT